MGRRDRREKSRALFARQTEDVAVTTVARPKAPSFEELQENKRVQAIQKITEQRSADLPPVEPEPASLNPALKKSDAGSMGSNFLLNQN